MAVFSPTDRVALYVHLRTFESDFDKSQSQMRAISSAWSAAVLAAIALVTITMGTAVVADGADKIHPAGVLQSRNEILAYLRALICCVGSAGVLAFWYIDQAVYQRLLHSVFAYGLFVEAEDRNLPQVRSSMYLANLDVTNRLGTFYRAQFWTFAVLSLVVNIASVVVGVGLAGGVWLVMLAHIAAVLVVEITTYNRWPSLSWTIRNFYPTLDAALPVRTAKPGYYEKTLRDVYDRLPPWAREERVGYEPSADPNMPAFLRRVRHQPETPAFSVEPVSDPGRS